MIRLAFPSLLLSALCAASPAWAQTQPGASTAPLESATRARYERAAAYSREHRGLAVLVRQGGRIVFESYSEGYGPEESHLLASGTKSFWGVAAACAVEDGLLRWDELVSETFPAWAEGPKAKVQVRHLLDLSSGLQLAKELRGPRVEDKYAFALQLPIEGTPGARFRYGPSHYYAFGALLAQKTGQDPLAYLRERVLDRIGLKIARWNRDRKGQATLPAGAYLSAREWSKFGELILREGRWGNEQVVASEHLRACFQPSAENPYYGLTFWLGGDQGGAGDPLAGVVFAAGMGNQRCYVIPAEDLVVVRQARNAKGWSDRAFLGHLRGLTVSAAAQRQEDRAAAYLRRSSLDTDNDGVVDRDELQPRALRLLWRRLDADRDGGLDIDELAGAIARFRDR